MSRILSRIARLRVPTGFLSAILVLWLSRPTATLMLWGGLLAVVGEGIRVWASGHLRKSREVTSSGPYRWCAHPLYLGSSVMGAGLAVACGSWVVALIIALYLGITISAAIRTEEALLRGMFGDNYDRYRRGAPRAGESDSSEGNRRFSLAQAIANREYRTVAGLVAAALLLLLKATL